MLKRALFFFCVLAHLSVAHAVPITAKVVGADGKPIAKAQVFVYSGLNSYPPPAPLTLATDQDGVFKADLNPATNPPNAYGMATVYVPGLALSGGLLKQGQNTIKMEPSIPVHGSVKDGAGKPIADAAVTLIAVFKSMNNIEGFVALVPEQLKSKFSAKSGADGTWTIDGVPAAYRGAVLLDDPRYVHAFAEFAAGGAPIALTAVVGATVTGKVVHEDGTPAAGIKVSAMGGTGGPFGANDTTDANGAYRLTGLGAGPVTVAASDPSGQWVALAVSDIKAKSGETVQAPNHTLIQGSFITGTVTDKATKAPISNVALWAGGENQVTVGGIEPVRSDKAGHYKIRVAPGKSTVMLLEQPKGYLPLEKPLEIEVGKGEAKELPIELNAGLTLAGIALDEKGKPVADVEIKATKKPNPNEVYEWVPPVTAKTDATGKWTLEGLRKGQWGLSSNGAWDVVSPQQVTLPATGEQKLKMHQLKLVALNGRVVTKDHKPLGAVKIKAHIQVPDGKDSWTADDQDVTSNVDGRFSLTNLRPDVQVNLAPDAAGYKFLTGGKVTRQGPGFEAQDIVLLPLAAKISGVVTDAGGKPVAGAKVMSPDGDPKVLVATDADGKFTLTSLPAGDVMVVAGYKGAVAEARDVNGKAPLSLKLQPVQVTAPGDIQRAYSLLDELWATTEGTQGYRDNIPVTLAAYDPDLAVKLASRKDGTINDSILSQIIAVVAKTDAARAAEWAVPKVSQVKDVYAAYTAKSSLAFALADLKPDVAKDFYTQAKAFDKDQTTKNPKEYQGISSRAALLSRIATKLHLTDEASQFAQAAIAASKEIPTSERTWILGPILSLNPDGRQPVALNPATGGKLLADLPQDQPKQALSNAITSSVNYGDLTTARLLLNKLTEIEKQNTNGGIYSGSAKQSIVEALAKHDPTAALELARNDSTRDTYNRSITLALVAQYQPQDVALQVLREAADAAVAAQSIDVNSRVAAIAYGLDPKLGAELFETAHSRLEAEKAQRESADISSWQNNNIADFAYYYSRLDPAESRLILEAEFARQKEVPKTSDNRWQYSNNLTNLIAAMAAVDVDRAMELTYLLPPPDKDNQWNNPQLEGQRLIAQYVLLSDAERRTKSFRDWDKGQGWQ